ncbi:MAG: hypothetical protein C0518_00990 [Opitutus sp.]|nr:hypothetical protein [Opitutus sp.]
MNDRDSFWHAYFSGLHGRHDLESAKRVGMSNDRVTAQEYALVIESCGVLAEKRALDVGCGLGPLARGLHALGAHVHGIDYVDTTIEALRQSDPTIEWSQEDISQPTAVLLNRRYDIVCACEVLQHVDPNETLRMLWGLLAPGGRLVGFVPNAACPIVQRVEKHYSGTYRGISSPTLANLAMQLPDVAVAVIRGASFQPEQTVVPYAASSWQRLEAAEWSAPPNRLQFVLVRQAIAPAVPSL